MIIIEGYEQKYMLISKKQINMLTRVQVINNRWTKTLYSPEGLAMLFPALLNKRNKHLILTKKGLDKNDDICENKQC